MIKNFVLLFLLFIAGFSATAQSKKFTPKKFSVNAGYAATNPAYTTLYANLGSSNIEASGGAFIGFNYNHELSSNWSVIPEISFVSTKQSSHYRAASLVEYRVPSTSLNLLAGPQVNILNGRESELYKRAGFELTGGIGVDLSSRFYLEGRFSRGFLNRYKSDAPVDEGDSYFFQTFTIGVGFRF